LEIPINCGLSPVRFSLNLRLSKTIGFGKKTQNANANAGGPQGGGTFGRGPGGPGGPGGRGGGPGGREACLAESGPTSATASLLECPRETFSIYDERGRPGSARDRLHRCHFWAPGQFPPDTGIGGTLPASEKKFDR